MTPHPQAEILRAIADGHTEFAIKTTNGRELLELAAKAAGVDIEFHGDMPWLTSGKRPWNPLEDDGDAFRLAVALGLVVDCSRPSAGEPYKHQTIWLDALMSTVELTRRAIVRAAAEIGMGMK